METFILHWKDVNISDHKWTMIPPYFSKAKKKNKKIKNKKFRKKKVKTFTKRQCDYQLKYNARGRTRQFKKEKYNRIPGLLKLS